ncbi:anaphase-promoting complex, cyclosome, subunit 4-domain-containing protein [Limtongia smithiae]|uniref:anaphase-promoting complex, cyclosome, subunit 4-domain-containing protein n=1 Tax=Limtongia smithiae TaxID=1125753 RepID=UPI0034D02114
MSDDGGGDAQILSFATLQERVVQAPVDTAMFTWCPAMDLLTFAPDTRTVWLYRMSGQLVWKLALSEPSIEICHLIWRPDGKMIALACSDASLRLCDVNNGRVIHQESTVSPMSSLSWVTEDDNAVKARNTSIFEGMFKVDIEASLPKLSILPTSTAESVFTSKFALDCLINSAFQSDALNSVDMLVGVSQSGSLEFSIFGRFTISDLAFPVSNLRPICHGTTSDLSFHGFLATTPSKELIYAYARTHFIRRFGKDLILISSSYAKVASLIHYIADVVIAIHDEWKPAEKYLRNALSSLDEVLKADKEDAQTPANVRLLETLIFGAPNSAMKKWVSERLSERVMRTWRKTSTGGYENMRKLILEALLPACERTIVILSRVRGLAKWHERGSPLGMDHEKFTIVLGRLELLMRKAHKFMWELNSEYEYFKEFLRWLKFIYDRLESTDPVSDDSEPGVETGKVVKYITQYMHQPIIHNFYNLDLKPREDTSDFIPTLVGLISKSCDAAFKDSADALKGHVVFGRPLALVSECDLGKLHVVQRVTNGHNVSYVYVTIVLGENSSEIILVRIAVSKVPSELLIPQYNAAKFILKQEKVVALSSLDDSKIILLLHPKEAGNAPSARLVSLDMASVFDEDESIARTFDLNLQQEAVTILLSGYEASEPKWSQCREFDSEFVPIALSVNGRKGRRVGCVLADDRQRFIVFDVDDEELDDEDDVNDEGQVMVE